MTTLHLRITGRVQAVGYRQWMVDAARRLGVSGWVRNLADGSVEAEVSGPPEAVDSLAMQCEAGPSLARVIEVRRTVLETAGRGEALPDRGFHLLPTAKKPER
jgi:acylphosphatase